MYRKNSITDLITQKWNWSSAMVWWGGKQHAASLPCLVHSLSGPDNSRSPFSWPWLDRIFWPHHTTGHFHHHCTDMDISVHFHYFTIFYSGLKITIRYLSVTKTQLNFGRYSIFSWASRNKRSLRAVWFGLAAGIKSLFISASYAIACSLHWNYQGDRTWHRDWHTDTDFIVKDILYLFKVFVADKLLCSRYWMAASRTGTMSLGPHRTLSSWPQSPSPRGQVGSSGHRMASLLKNVNNQGATLTATTQGKECFKIFGIVTSLPRNACTRCTLKRRWFSPDWAEIIKWKSVSKGAMGPPDTQIFSPGSPA